MDRFSHKGDWDELRNASQDSAVSSVADRQGLTVIVERISILCVDQYLLAVGHDNIRHSCGAHYRKPAQVAI